MNTNTVSTASMDFSSSPVQPQAKVGAGSDPLHIFRTAAKDQFRQRRVNGASLEGRSFLQVSTTDLTRQQSVVPKKTPEMALSPDAEGKEEQKGTNVVRSKTEVPTANHPISVGGESTYGQASNTGGLPNNREAQEEGKKYKKHMQG